MIKISIFKEHPYENTNLVWVYRIRRDNGSCLGEFKREDEALAKAWELVCTYGLTLVEPW